MHEDALGAGDTGFDDLALWTGSVARGDDGVWRLYYTALNTEGRGVKDQRIGLAESDDLMTWRRVGERAAGRARPVPLPDARRRLRARPGATRSCSAHDGGWHMLITARDPAAERLFDGVLAHARSDDMRDVGARAAADRAGEVRAARGRRRCAASTGSGCCSSPAIRTSRREPRPFCTWYVLGDSPLGPWDVASARPFEDEPKLFAAPLVQRRDGSWAFVGFLNRPGVCFDIVDPIPVELTEGTLRRSAPGP